MTTEEFLKLDPKDIGQSLALQQHESQKTYLIINKVPQVRELCVQAVQKFQEGIEKLNQQNEMYLRQILCNQDNSTNYTDDEKKPDKNDDNVPDELPVADSDKNGRNLNESNNYMKSISTSITMGNDDNNNNEKAKTKEYDDDPDKVLINNCLTIGKPTDDVDDVSTIGDTIE